MSNKFKKCKKGTIGKPLFKRGDTVSFYMQMNEQSKPHFFTGTVYIVDRYGTFEQNKQPSYDIMVEDFGDGGCLFKHVVESSLYYQEV